MQLPVGRLVGIQIHEAQRQVPEIDEPPIRTEERRLDMEESMSGSSAANTCGSRLTRGKTFAVESSPQA